LNKQIHGRGFFPYSRIIKNLCRYFALKDMDHNSSTLKYGQSLVTSFQRIQFGKKRKKNNFTVEKLNKHKLSKLTSLVVSD